MSEFDLKAEELKLRAVTLEIERTKLFIEFAKFGFRGTLAGAITGMFLILALALIQSFTPKFAIDTWGYVAIIITVAVAVTAYGYFSLWSLPTIATKFKQIEIAMRG